MIETERLILREITMDDFNSLYKILSNKKTMSFWPRPFDSEQVKNWIERNINNYKENGIGRWIVESKENNEIIGDVGFLIIDIDGKKENDLGYIIDSKYWRNDYGFEASRACLEYGFNKLGMKRIVANMAHDHNTSIKVAEKLGMIKEKEFINKKNRNILTYLYSKEK